MEWKILFVSIHSKTRSRATRYDLLQCYLKFLKISLFSFQWMSQFLRSNQSSSLGRRQWSEIQITSKVNSRVRRFLRSNHYRSQDPFWWNGRMVQFRKTLRQIQRLWSHSIANQCWNQRRRKSNLRYIFDFFYIVFKVWNMPEIRTSLPL